MAQGSTQSIDAFRNRIRDFAKMRLAPLLSPTELATITSFLTMQIEPEQTALFDGKTDWPALREQLGISSLSADAKRNIQYALDAITRWHGVNTPGRRDRTAVKDRASTSPARAEKAPPLSRSVRITKGGNKRGPKPPPVIDKPTPLFTEWEDPVSFQAALELHMRRFGETYYRLHQSIVSADERFDNTTLRHWLTGTKVPRTVESFDVLKRIENRYGLPDGYFKAKLPHQSRSAYGHDVGEEIPSSERRRLAWHLPDDFNYLGAEKQQEILEWVRRVIISGATDYRRFQAAAMKQRYAIRFPTMTYGEQVDLRQPAVNNDMPSETGSTEDPDLLPGVLRAPPRLALEMANLIAFKTSTLTAIGFQRNGVWGEETAFQKLEHLGLMFGALAAHPDGDVAGRGVPLSHLTFGLLVFPGIWDWYLQWRERRRGFYTAWEVDMLSIALALTREETGWLRQHPEYLQNVRPVPGLVSEGEIAFARKDWHACCDAFHKHARNRIREIQRVMRVHRDPFEPIMCVLEAASPSAEYRKITEEILLRMPDGDRYPRAAAEAVRSFLMLRFGLHLGLRKKNLRQMLFCPRGRFPTSERRLAEMKRGELRWSERDGGWEVLIPSIAFKNATSSFFGAKPFRLILPDLMGLYQHIDAYAKKHRDVLLNDAADPGTFFIKTVKRTSTDAAYDQTTFYEAWRLTIQRYGVYNPYTKRGAIKGLLPHGPHNVRDVLATHILKLTGSYEQASYAIQDTPEMVRQHWPVPTAGQGCARGANSESGLGRCGVINGSGRALRNKIRRFCASAYAP